jgi:hypothetical protein
MTFLVPDCGAQPTAINNDLVIVGTWTNGSGGFIRNAFGKSTLLPNLTPTGINVHGLMTGYIRGNFDFNAQGFVQWFVRSPSGQITTFSAGPLGTDTDTFPTAINAAGQVAGWIQVQDKSIFLRNPDGKTKIFPQPSGVIALDINDFGEIAGTEVDRFDNLFGPIVVQTPNGTITPVGPVNFPPGCLD